MRHKYNSLRNVKGQISENVFLLLWTEQAHAAASGLTRTNPVCLGKGDSGADKHVFEFQALHSESL